MHPPPERSRKRHLKINSVEHLGRYNASSCSLDKSQRLDPQQSQKLSLMPNRRELQPGTNVVQSPPKAATPLPPGYHLVYMAPASLEDDLGADGTDKTFNPPGTFTRRMWAGGSMAWSKQNLLRIGEDVEEWTRLISAVPKTSRDGHEMVLVEIENEFANSNGVALTDRRYAYVVRMLPCYPCWNRMATLRKFPLC
jgi:hydroxyacyl-ACP dehydratase HTD2-like protein with hotdog domain